MQEELEELIIVGSGPAGYTAALYAARADLRPLVIEGFAWGGLLQQTTEVENFPGYRDGVMGPEMMQELRDQAERFGTRFITDDATGLDLTDGAIQTAWVGDEPHRAKALVLAMGAQHKELGVSGEDELAGRGVSYCATCDGAFFKDHHVCVVGGGDSAMEETIFLAKFAASVTIVHRRDEFRASPIMLDRARAVENVEVRTPWLVTELVAGADGKLATARLLHAETDERDELAVTGAFVAIGHEPQSRLVRGRVDLDPNGYVVTQGDSTRTNLAGVLAAGDLVDHTYRQAVTAAGSGCKAALDAEWYLRDTPPQTESVAAPAASGA